MKKNNFQLKGWIQKAKDDLSFAQDTFSESKYWDYVCWLAHQAVEKYLKAFIIKGKNRLDKKDKTHNLIYLANICSQYGLDLSPYESYLRWLSEIYIPARYPIHPIVRFNKKDAEESLDKAKEIIKAIKKKLQN